MTGGDNDAFNRWHQDPENWKWGLFYFNRKDSRLMVPKRVASMGITLNFAHPLAMLVFILIISAILLLASVTK
jgi:uncharacterized membrane protein